MSNQSGHLRACCNAQTGLISGRTLAEPNTAGPLHGPGCLTHAKRLLGLADHAWAAVFRSQSWPTRRDHGVSDTCIAKPYLVHGAGLRHQLSRPSSCSVGRTGCALRAARVLNMNTGMRCQARAKVPMIAGSLVRQRPARLVRRLGQFGGAAKPVRPAAETAYSPHCHNSVTGAATCFACCLCNHSAHYGFGSAMVALNLSFRLTTTTWTIPEAIWQAPVGAALTRLRLVHFRLESAARRSSRRPRQHAKNVT